MFRNVDNSIEPRGIPADSQASTRAGALPEKALPLPQIAPDEKVKIVTETIPSALLPLFQAMGLCSGCDLRVCQSKGTCILDVDGSRVGISNQLAASVQAIPIA